MQNKHYTSVMGFVTTAAPEQGIRRSANPVSQEFAEKQQQCLPEAAVRLGFTHLA